MTAPGIFRPSLALRAAELKTLDSGCRRSGSGAVATGVAVGHRCRWAEWRGRSGVVDFDLCEFALVGEQGFAVFAQAFDVKLDGLFD